MSNVSYELLNLFEIDEPDGVRHYVCFLDPLQAGVEGIEWRCVVGEFVPTPDGEFDPATFRLNPEFIASFVDYMNDQMLTSGELLEQAGANPDSVLHLLDPRTGEPEGEPADEDLLGGFAIDSEGHPIADSFRYNPDHVMFHPSHGPSGILIDRRFYDWLHASPRPE